MSASGLAVWCPALTAKALMKGERCVKVEQY